MNKYHKIQSVFKRDKNKKFIIGEWTIPEFNYLKMNYWFFTEKINGMNIRVLWDHENEKVTFYGKTNSAQLLPKLVTNLYEMFSTDILKRMFPKTSVCLYGEGYGNNIKGDNLYNRDPSFILFDVKIGSWWLRRSSIEDIASKLNIDVVPIIGIGNLLEAIELTKNGFKSIFGDFIAEGIVAKPTIELFTRDGERIITKVKHKDFIK